MHERREVMIEVRLFATLRQGREKSIMLDSKEFPTAKDILDHLDILPGEVSILLVNGFHKTPEAQLEDGDVVALFPPVGGG